MQDSSDQGAGTSRSHRDLDWAALGVRSGHAAVFVDQVGGMDSLLGSFSDGARASGSKADTIWISRTMASATEAEYQKLGLQRGALVARLSRIRLWDGEPLASEHALVPGWALESIDLIEGSIYAELERIGNRPIRARQVIRASLATSIEAAMLHIAELSAVLRMERIGMRHDGRVVELTRSIYRGDRFQFIDTLRGSLVSVSNQSTGCPR